MPPRKDGNIIAQCTSQGARFGSKGDTLALFEHVRFATSGTAGTAGQLGQRDSWDSGTSGTAGTLGQARENTAIAPRSRKNVSLIWIASRKRLNGQSRCGQSGWLRPGRQAVPSPSAAPLTVAASSREAQVAGPISALRLKDHGRARHERAEDRHHLEQCRGKQQRTGPLRVRGDGVDPPVDGQLHADGRYALSSVARLRLPKCKIQPLRQIRQLPVSDVPTCPVVPPVPLVPSVPLSRPKPPRISRRRRLSAAGRPPTWTGRCARKSAGWSDPAGGAPAGPHRRRT
jgi:hypothetical protein